MENCIFCKIINKQIQSNIVYEDNEIIAFLDITQVTNGHTLVVPKKHFDSIFDCDEETLSKINIVIKKISQKMNKNLNVSNINILNNSGDLAGQTVKHLHFHIIPRYNSDDGIVIKFNDNKAIESIDFANILNNLKI